MLKAGSVDDWLMVRRDGARGEGLVLTARGGRTRATEVFACVYRQLTHSNSWRERGRKEKSKYL